MSRIIGLIPEAKEVKKQEAVAEAAPAVSEEPKKATPKKSKGAK